MQKQFTQRIHLLILTYKIAIDCDYQIQLHQNASIHDDFHHIRLIQRKIIGARDREKLMKLD